MLTRVRFPSMKLSVSVPDVQLHLESWSQNGFHWKHPATSEFLNYPHSLSFIQAHLLPITVISSCFSHKLKKEKTIKKIDLWKEREFRKRCSLWILRRLQISTICRCRVDSEVALSKTVIGGWIGSSLAVVHRVRVRVRFRIRSKVLFFLEPKRTRCWSSSWK